MSEEQPARSNVRSLTRGGFEAEEILRDALAEVAEIRSRGKEPQVIILYLEEDGAPGLGRSAMKLDSLTLCAAVLNAAVHQEVLAAWESDL